MADVKVKLFGVYRTDTRIAETTINADKLADIFPALNSQVEEKYLEKKKSDPSLEKPELIKLKDALVYINGEKCSKKGRALENGAEIWIMSPASGG